MVVFGGRNLTSSELNDVHFFDLLTETVEQKRVDCVVAVVVDYIVVY
jgi:hypothetical protein